MQISSVVSRPITVALPGHGVFFAESVHASRFDMEWRSDPFHKIVHVLKGATVHATRTPARELALDAGSLVIIPAGIPHRLQDREPAILLLLCLDKEFVGADAEMAALWQALLRSNQPVFRPGPWGRQRLENLWRHAILEQTRAQPGMAVALKAAAAQILVQISRMSSEKGAGDVERRVASVLREMEESFFEEWTLDRAAARAGISRRTLSGHFRRLAGQSFLERLLELRLGHASWLLRQGHHSIVGAAFSSGYRDLSHFYRLFRQRYGMTPKAWMNQRLKPKAGRAVMRQ